MLTKEIEMIVERMPLHVIKKVKRLHEHKHKACGLLNIDSNRRHKFMIKVENKIISLLDEESKK